MEKNKRDKITALLPELIQHIDCNAVLIAHLRETETIEFADEQHLITLANKLDQAKALLNMLCTKKNGYKLLVEGLRKTSQTGALDILNEPIQVKSTEGEISDSALEFLMDAVRKLPPPKGIQK